MFHSPKGRQLSLADKNFSPMLSANYRFLYCKTFLLVKVFLFNGRILLNEKPCFFGEWFCVNEPHFPEKVGKILINQKLVNLVETIQNEGKIYFYWMLSSSGIRLLKWKRFSGKKALKGLFVIHDSRILQFYV